MIALSSDCLVFRMAGGEYMAFSPEMISQELVGDGGQEFDREFVEHAANAVFHYFKHEMGKAMVTVGEFAGALEKVLHGFGRSRLLLPGRDRLRAVTESNLCDIAVESGVGCDLFFFSYLRCEVRRHLATGPQVLRFSGLRKCARHLTGVKRRTRTSRDLEERVVQFLRDCLLVESGKAADVSMVVS